MISGIGDGQFCIASSLAEWHSANFASFDAGAGSSAPPPPPTSIVEQFDVDQRQRQRIAAQCAGQHRPFASRRLFPAPAERFPTILRSGQSLAQSHCCGMLSIHFHSFTIKSIKSKFIVQRYLFFKAFSFNHIWILLIVISVC